VMLIGTPLMYAGYTMVQTFSDFPPKTLVPRPAARVQWRHDVFLASPEARPQAFLPVVRAARDDPGDRQAAVLAHQSAPRQPPPGNSPEGRLFICA
jgi:hypothetical protein